MINLFNKLLSRFNLQVVPKQEELPEKELTFLENIITLEFAQKHPDFLDRYIEAQKKKSLYIGDLNYLEDKKTGKTYFHNKEYEYYFCDYNVDNPPKKFWSVFTKEQLEEKLKEDT